MKKIKLVGTVPFVLLIFCSPSNLATSLGVKGQARHRFDLEIKLLGISIDEQPTLQFGAKIRIKAEGNSEALTFKSFECSGTRNFARSDGEFICDLLKKEVKGDRNGFELQGASILVLGKEDVSISTCDVPIMLFDETELVDPYSFPVRKVPMLYARMPFAIIMSTRNESGTKMRADILAGKKFDLLIDKNFKRIYGGEIAVYLGPNGIHRIKIELMPRPWDSEFRYPFATAVKGEKLFVNEPGNKWAECFDRNCLADEFMNGNIMVNFRSETIGR